MIFIAADSLLATDSREGFALELIRLAQHIGFGTTSATVLIDHLNARTGTITVDNTPTGYYPVYLGLGPFCEGPGHGSAANGTALDRLGSVDLR